MINSYDGLSRHYDLIMTSGFCDYEAYATTILSLLENRRSVLELGVGTGLVCEKLLQLGENDLSITGIDHTESMLVQAKDRLGSRVRLIRQDVLQMVLPAKFEAAFSVGGVWFFIHDGDDTLFCSHILEDAANIRALKGVHDALEPDSVLLIAAQGPHVDYEKELPGGLMLCKQVAQAGDDSYFTNDYHVKWQEQIMAHQRCEFRLFTEAQADAMLKECGFRFRSVSEDGLLHQYVSVDRRQL